MITTTELLEFNSSYYKTLISKEVFMEKLKEYMLSTDRYIYKTFLHENGIFFERITKRSFPNFSNKIEIIFSERKNNSLLAISYYVPIFTKQFTYILLLLPLGIVIASSILNFSSNNLRILNIIILALIWGKDAISAAIHRLMAREINSFLKMKLNSPEKLNLKTYQLLLNDDWDK